MSTKTINSIITYNQTSQPGKVVTLNLSGTGTFSSSPVNPLKVFAIEIIYNRSNTDQYTFVGDAYLYAGSSAIASKKIGSAHMNVNYVNTPSCFCPVALENECDNRLKTETKITMTVSGQNSYSGTSSTYDHSCFFTVRIYYLNMDGSSMKCFSVTERLNTNLATSIAIHYLVPKDNSDLKAVLIKRPNDQNGFNGNLYAPNGTNIFSPSLKSSAVNLRISSQATAFLGYDTLTLSDISSSPGAYNNDVTMEFWYEKLHDTIKSYDGSSWKEHTIHYFDGTDYKYCTAYYYDGEKFVKCSDS